MFDFNFFICFFVFFFLAELESFLIEITATILRKKDDQSPLKKQNIENSNSDDEDAEDEIRYIT
jgi:hypothetical protein